MPGPCRQKLVPQIALHFDRVVQFPAQLAGVGNTDGIDRAHAQFDLPRRQPRETLVRQGGSRVGVADQFRQNGAAVRACQRKHPEFRRHILLVDAAKAVFLLHDRFVKVVLVIGVPGPGRDEVIVILGQTHDGIFGAGRALWGQRIGQVDPPHFRQGVGGEPIEERGCPRPTDPVFCKGGGVDQPRRFADRFRLIDRILPPATPAERPGVVVEIIRRVQRAIVDRPFPAVDLTELRPKRLLPVIDRSGAQGAGGFAFLIRVMQDEDVVIAFLILPRGVLGGHPAAEPLGVKRRHVDLCLTRNHHLCEVVTGATGGGDAERKALGQPHVLQTWRRADQRVAVGGIADRTVEIVFQPHSFRRRNPVDERHVFLFDPFQIQREQVGAETGRDIILEPRRCALFVRPQNPAPAFFADIPFGVGVAQNRVLVMGLAVFDQHRVRFGDNVLMFHRDRRNPDAQQFRGALGMVAGGGDNMFSGDFKPVVRRHQIAALFHHASTGNDPFSPGPAVAIHLYLSLKAAAKLPRPLGHRLGHIGGVYVTVLRVVKRPDQVVGPHQRPAVLDVLG